MSDQLDRRGFLKNGLALSSSLALPDDILTNNITQPASLPQSPAPITVAPMERVRFGFIGVGGRGTDLLKQLLRVEGAEVRAVCDLREDRVKRAQEFVEKAGQPKPKGYSGGETEYQRLLEQNDVDIVLNATLWQKHNAINVASLNAGKHVATEVPAALTLAECWEQVNASEKNRRHCIILENYCYQRDVMMLTKLAREGRFGETMHAEGGYQKDARYYDIQTDEAGQLTWQGQFRTKTKGNMYPTHDIGPIAHWLDINRGDCFEYVVSMASNAYAYNEYGREHFGPDHFIAKTKFDMSDINVCLIRTAKGKSVYLILDTLLSRPHPRNVYRLMGTDGIYDRTINSLFLESISKMTDKKHGEGEWDKIDALYAQHDHPLWKDLGEKAQSSGHGGGDFLMLHNLVRAFRTGAYPDIDVYDAATWSSIIELTDQSARNGSKPMAFPDFTRGRWKSAEPVALKGA